MSHYQLYRNTTLGVTLQDTLDEMIASGSLTEQAKRKVLNQFDRSMNLALEKSLNKRVQFTGKLSTYRFCDNVWTLILKELSVKDNHHAQQNTNGSNQLIYGEKVKFVACDGKSSS